MRMSIEEAHEILSNGLVNASSEHEWCVAFKMAIDTMRKYQKIEELIEYHMLKFLPKERMSGFQKDILEVIEDGNDD